MSVDVVIVNTGGANLASIGHAFARLGHTVRVTDDGDAIRRASHVILPGVGAAGDTMARLNDNRLAEVIQGLTQPVLGICLGMHLLAAHSAEDDVACLGLLSDVRVSQLSAAPDRPVPHMGWNRVRQNAPGRLLDGLGPESYFYFVHSYALPGTATGVVATTDYGTELAAVVEHGNFVATQFHPERSAGNGVRVLKNFLEL